MKRVSHVAETIALGTFLSPFNISYQSINVLTPKHILKPITAITQAGGLGPRDILNTVTVPGEKIFKLEEKKPPVQSTSAILHKEDSQNRPSDTLAPLSLNGINNPQQEGRRNTTNYYCPVVMQCPEETPQPTIPPMGQPTPPTPPTDEVSSSQQGEGIAAVVVGGGLVILSIISVLRKRKGPESTSTWGDPEE